MKFKGTLGSMVIAAAAMAGAGTLTVAAPGTTVARSSAAGTAETAPATAAHRGHRHGGMLVGLTLRAVQQLNPTPEQQAQINALLSSAHAQSQALRQMPDLTVLGNPGDPNYATALLSARSNAAARMEREVELQSQIYAILTPQQKAQLPQVLAAMKAKAEARRAAWQQRNSAPAGSPEASGAATEPSGASH